jgi:hypothetical protein
VSGRPKHVVMTAFLGTKVAAIGRVAAFGWTKIAGTATASLFSETHAFKTFPIQGPGCSAGLAFRSRGNGGLGGG